MRLRSLFLIVVMLMAVMLLQSFVAAGEAPMISASEMMPSDQIKPGMKGYGLTVFKGSRIERFNITVIGVLENYEFDSDLILARITSGPVVTRDWGVIAGMSGSPVYINGKLIGAVAYGWTFSKEPIAGITPIGKMIEDFAPETFMRRSAGATAPFGMNGRMESTPLISRDGPIRINGRNIERFELMHGIPEADTVESGTMTLAPIATPVMVSGLSPRAIEALKKIFKPYGLVPMAGGGKAPAGMTAKPRPGGAIGLQLAGGDIDMTSVGTVTYVKDGKVLAMGHPFQTSGPIDFPMVNAHVYGVMPSLDFSSKIATGGKEIIGRWTQDRAHSVGGLFGKPSGIIPMEMSVHDVDRKVDKKYSVHICRNRNITAAISAVVLESAIDSISHTGEGTLETELTIEAEGLPLLTRKGMYSQAMGNDFYSFFMGGGSPGWEAMEILQTLYQSKFGPIEPRRVVLRAEWTDERKAALIEEVRTRANVVRPGDKIEVELLIRPWKKALERHVVEVEIPKNVAPGEIAVGIAGGMSVDMIKQQLGIKEPTPHNFAQQWELYRKDEKDNDLVVAVGLGTLGLEVEGEQLLSLPNIVAEVAKSVNITGIGVVRDYKKETKDMPYVLSGGAVLELRVETDEKEKAGRGPAASGGRGAGRMGGPGGGGMIGFEEEMVVRSQTDPSEDEGEGEDEEILPDDDFPEMPSWEEVTELESQEPEEVTAETSKGTVKGETLLRAPGIWKETAEKDFEKGKTFGTAINSLGRIELVGENKTLFSEKEGLLWAQTTDGGGNLYVGSWISGEVKKIASDGSSTTVLDSGEAAIQSLTCDKAGNLFAAAAPSGSIYKISPEGEATLFCKAGSPYVWSMAADSDGGLIAATGPEGRLLRISPQGEVQEVFRAPDRHIIALAKSNEDVWYVATYPKGKIYRFGKDKVEPFYETVGGVTALSIAADKAGNLYVGTTPKGNVIVLDPLGKARMLYRSKERHIHAILPTEKGIYVATGPKARIYRVSANGDAALIWDGKAGNVLSLSQNGGNLQALLADGRKVVEFSLKDGIDGNFVSHVLDATGPSKWGQIRWLSDQPEETLIYFQTRSGNTAYPDSTWSDWSAPYFNAAGEGVSSPESRYLQYRTMMKSMNEARPVVRQVEIFYMQKNRPPEVELTAPVQGPVWSGKQSIKWKATDPNKDTLDYQVFYSGDNGQTWNEIKEGQSKSNNANSNSENEIEEQKEEEAKNGDEEKEEEPKDRPAPRAKGTSVKWDTTKVEDGLYLIKVVANDEKSNPKEALSDERISEPFRIDNTPPVIVLDKTTEAPPATVLVAEAGSYVASAKYRVDGGEWKPALAEDGIFDGLAETVLIDAADLTAGKHELEVSARDGVGNETSNNVTYEKPE